MKKKNNEKKSKQNDNIHSYTVPYKTVIFVEQMNVLKDPELRQIRWNNSALTFFCIVSVFTRSLGMAIEDTETEALGVFLIAELGENMDGYHSISSF